MNSSTIKSPTLTHHTNHLDLNSNNLEQDGMHLRVTTNNQQQQQNHPASTNTSRNGSFDFHVPASASASSSVKPSPSNHTTTTATSINISSSNMNNNKENQSQQQEIVIEEDSSSPASPTESEKEREEDSTALSEPYWCETQSFLPKSTLLFVKDNRAFFRLALPSIVIQFVRNIIAAIPFAFAGRLLDKEHLGGYILGFSFSNAVGVAVGMGISSVLDTLATQARGYHGARSTVVGVHLRTTYFVAILYSIGYFLTCVLFGSATISLLRPDLLDSAMAFLIPSVGVVFGTTFVSSTHKFLNAQHKTPIALYGYILGSLLALVLALWINSSKDGDLLQGDQIRLIVALSLTIGIGRFSSGVFMFLIAMRDPDVYFCWTGKNISNNTNESQKNNTNNDDKKNNSNNKTSHDLWMESVRWTNMKTFFSYCGHSIVSACADRWSMEILTVMLAGAHKYSEVDLDAFGTLTTIWIFSFPLSVGCYVAISCLCGNALGKGDGQEAHRAVVKSLRWGITSCSIFCVIYSLFPGLFSRLLVASDEINEKILQVAWIYALGALGDSVQFIFQGMFRAAGRIALVSRSSAICQWAIAIPLAAILVLKYDYGLSGLGIGMGVGNLLQCVVFAYEYRAIEWDSLAKSVKEEHEARHGGRKKDEEELERLEQQQDQSQEQQQQENVQ